MTFMNKIAVSALVSAGTYAAYKVTKFIRAGKIIHENMSDMESIIKARAEEVHTPSAEEVEVILQAAANIDADAANVVSQSIASKMYKCADDDANAVVRAYGEFLVSSKFSTSAEDLSFSKWVESNPAEFTTTSTYDVLIELRDAGVDPYAILLLPMCAPLSKCRESFKKLSSELHPDKHPDASDNEKTRLSNEFAKISAAYEMVRVI